MSSSLRQKILDKIKAQTGAQETKGISDELLAEFLADDQQLHTAIQDAEAVFEALPAEERELLGRCDESELLDSLQSDYLNFYQPDCRCPYLPLAASGPWVVTAYGAVVFDAGGYGMLGFGHAPQNIIEAMAPNFMMANIMTTSLEQRRFTQLLLKEIGRNRSSESEQPFHRFICMNSGSEAISVASRLIDIHLKTRLPADRDISQIKTPVYLALEDSFHGRTYKAAQISHSTFEDYQKHLYSFLRPDTPNTRFIRPNDISALKAAFDRAEREGRLIAAMFLEPVQGEGNPGLALDPKFYEVARELTSKHGALLVIDSIQAGLRAHGVLSLVDYPGFEHLLGPDIEVYSKALNAGQFPLSIVALTEKTAKFYKTGVYGNTMTGNPRALSVACAVLDALDEELRQNIVSKGQLFVEKLEQLRAAYPDDFGKAQGTGLLFSIGLNPERHKILGDNGAERQLRRAGLNIIHGGESNIRFTPHFAVSEQQVRLVIEILRQVLTDS